MNKNMTMCLAFGALLVVALWIGVSRLRNSPAPAAGGEKNAAAQAASTARSEASAVAVVSAGRGSAENPAAQPTQTSASAASTASITSTSVAVAATSNPAAAIIAPTPAAGAMTRYDSKPGTLKVRIEGNSNIHKWQVEGKIIGGYVEAGANFPTRPGQAVAPGNVDARVEAFIPVKSLSSVKEDGSPYSTAMDDIMYGKLRVAEQPRIFYRLSGLTLKEAPKSPDGPYALEAVGELAAAGVTNKISMPVSVTPAADGKIRITGTVGTRMTDFNIQPPAPVLGTDLIKTDDPVTLIFDWTVAQRKAAAGTK